MSLQLDTARNGQRIFKLDGRAIVSSYDPLKEARGWAANAVKEIGDCETVIILGAGCGYHIVALRELLPSLSILTIEESKEIAAFAHDVLASQHEADVRQFGEILVAAKPMELTESLILRDFMSQRYSVVTHAGLAALRPQWTHEMAKFLTGRDFLSFLLQVRMRPELHALFDEEKIAKLQASTAPITILTLRNLFSAQAQTTRERRLWRVLEELIA